MNDAIDINLLFLVVIDLCQECIYAITYLLASLCHQVTTWAWHLLLHSFEYRGCFCVSQAPLEVVHDWIRGPILRFTDRVMRTWTGTYLSFHLSCLTAGCWEVAFKAIFAPVLLEEEGEFEELTAEHSLRLVIMSHCCFATNTSLITNRECPH